jgi:thiamine transporter ThiT
VPGLIVAFSVGVGVGAGFIAGLLLALIHYALRRTLGE